MLADQTQRAWVNTEQRGHYALQLNRDFDTQGAETGGSRITSQRVQIEWHTAYIPNYLGDNLCIISQAKRCYGSDDRLT